MASGSGKNALFVLIFFGILYSFFSIGHFGGDGYQDYLTAESIVLDGNLALYDRPGDKDEIQYGERPGVEGKDGRTYSARSGAGMALMLVPFYFTGEVVSKLFQSVPHDHVTMLFVSFANPVFCALSVLAVFLISARLFSPGRIPLVVSFIFGLSTMFPVYARTGFSEPASVLFLLLSFHALLLYKDRPAITYTAASALLLFLAVFVKATSLIFVPCYLVYLIWVLGEEKTALSYRLVVFLLYSLVFTALFAGMLFFNYRVYGGVLSFGATHAVEFGKRIAEAPHVLKGLYYYLLSTGKGFFLYNLPLLVVFASLGAAWARKRKETVFFMLVFAVNLLFYVKSFRRGSLFSWGPRYLLPSVPFLVMFTGFYLERYRLWAAKALAACLSLAGFLVLLPCLLVNQSKFYNFVVEKLGLEEYMINFIPDLSPVKGAWSMLLARIAEIFGHAPAPFVYSPDYRLVQPVSALMGDYNYMDIWFLKVAEKAPAFAPYAYITLAVLFLAGIFSLYRIFYADEDRYTGP